MNTRLNLVLGSALIASAALVGCKKKEEPMPAPPVAAPAPVATTAPAAAPAATATATISSVDLGNAVGADMKVTTPATSFTTADTVYAAVSTATSDPAATVPGKLTAKWTHIASGKVAHEETKEVNFAGSGVTNFFVKGLPAGKYKVEITKDGALAQTKEFDVK